MTTEARIEMPNGMTLRTTSKRRYLVAVYSGNMVKWQIVYRSDRESNALAQWRHYARLNGMTNLVDRETREVIR